MRRHENIRDQFSVVLEQENERRDVRVWLETPSAKVADLLVAAHVESDGIFVAGRFHTRETALAEVGLYQGVRLAIGPQPQRQLTLPSGGPVLAFTDGPGAGALVQVTGEQLMGRSEHCDLVVHDPSVSRRHARLQVQDDTTVEISDLRSENGTWIGDVPVLRPTLLPPGSVVRFGATYARLLPSLPQDRSGARSSTPDGGPVAFNRPPRQALPGPPDPRTPPSPPVIRPRHRVLDVMTIAGPLLIGGLLIWLYREPRFAVFLLLGPLIAGGNWLTGRYRDRRNGQASDRAFQVALAAFAHQLDQAASDETARREAFLPDAAETVRRAILPSTQLWQRRQGHDDFLRLRAGIGKVPWTPPVNSAKGEIPEEVEAVIAAKAVLHSCPVEADLADGKVVGLVGDRQGVLALARSLVCQAAVHHGPADLAMVVCAAQTTQQDWDWLKWLPHVCETDGLRTVTVGSHASQGLLGRLLTEGVERTTLFVLDDISLLDGRRPSARLLLEGAGGPGCGIVLADSADQLPAVTSTVVRIASDLGDADLLHPQTGERIENVATTALAEPLAREVARSLARFEDPDLKVAGAGLPGDVRLLPLLGLESDPAQEATEQETAEQGGAEEKLADAVLRAWADRRPEAPLVVPIGLAEDGPVAIDLVADGPHALIGGTTGSGKSELLRSLVVGLAATVDPDHLVFVLVDYKGGSTFDACATLPQVVGVVTDLDEHLGARALRSLEAEVALRERLLRAAGAADLPAYLAAGAPGGPMPRLVVVIDEFATLAAELPQFLGALVGIAQRGRSLGIHLVLATQRPSGVVSASIKANTNLRIALRVQDPADSNDIIDRPDASAIDRRRPGRAYLRRGHEDIVLIQTALATARGAPKDQTAVRIVDFGLIECGLIEFGLIEAAAGEPDKGAGASDLLLLAEAVGTAFARSGRCLPRSPWQPMLKDLIPLDDLLDACADERMIPLGLADDPDHQRQAAWGWVPEEGSLGIFGMVGSGTTTALVALALSLAQRRSPDDVHLHALDYGGGGLASLAALPHTGAVVSSASIEDQIRLFRFLLRQMDRRRGLTPSARATEPLIVLLVDGVGAFLASQDDQTIEAVEAFHRIFTEGSALGILLAVAGERPSALPPRLLATVSQRLLLRMADPSDFAGAGLRFQELPAFVPGRGIAASGLVVQIGHPGPDVPELAARIRAEWPGPTRPAPPIRRTPERLMIADLGESARIEADLVALPLGVRDDDLATAFLRLGPFEHALIAGPPRSGKTSALQTIAALARAADPQAVLVAVCRPTSPLYELDAIDAAGSLAEMAGVARLATREGNRLWMVLVDECHRVDDPDGVLAELMQAHPRLHVIGAGSANALRTAYGHWTRGLRQGRLGVLLQPDLAADGDLLGVRLPRRLSIPLPQGRGFLVSSGQPELVQIALQSDS